MHELVGKPVNLTTTLDGHELKRVVGCIVDASLVGTEVRVVGRIFDKNWPEMAQLVTQQAPSLGMSYEISEVAVFTEAYVQTAVFS